MPARRAGNRVPEVRTDPAALIEELKARTALLEAEAAVLNAQKGRLEAEQALAKATDPTQAAVDRAKAAKDTAEAIRDSYRALLPQTTALEGTTTIDDKVLLESEILAYGKLDEIARKIAADLQNVNATALIVYSEREIEALLAYQQFATFVEVLRAEYDRITRSSAPGVQPAIAPAVAAGIAGVSAAIDLLGLLRQNLEIKGTEFTVPEVALVALIARELRKPITIMYPALVPRLADAASSDVLVKLKALGDAKRAAHHHLGPEKPKNEPADPRHAELAEIDKLYTTFVTALGKADEKSGTGTLSGLLRGEALHTALGGTARVLVVRTISARGSNRVRQSRLSFSGGVDHSGGAIVMYMVLGPDGSILKSGVEKGYTGFVKAPQDREGEAFP